MQCPIFEGEQLICLNPVDYDVRGNDAEVVNMVQGNGLMRYSNILFALLSTFKQTFVTGSSRLIMLYKQVLNPIFIQVYFYSYIYLMYIYLYLDPIFTSTFFTLSLSLRNGTINNPNPNLKTPCLKLYKFYRI